MLGSSLSEASSLLTKCASAYNLADSLASTNLFLSKKVASTADALALQFVEKVALAAKKKKYASESPSTREVKHSEMEKYTGYGREKKAFKNYLGRASAYLKNNPEVAGVAKSVGYGVGTGLGLAGGGYYAANKLVDDSLGKAQDAASSTLGRVAIPAIAAIAASSGLGSYFAGKGRPQQRKTASMMACLDIYEKTEGTPLQKEAALLLVDCLLDRE